MNLKIAIIGDGIIGLSMAWRLKEMSEITIYGDGDMLIPSIHGAAVINPIANKKNQIVEDFDLKLQYAISLYQDIEMQLGVNKLVTPITLLKIIPDGIAYNDYIQCISSNAQKVINQSWMMKGCNIVEVHGVCKVNREIVKYLRTYFEEKNSYIKQKISTSDVAIIKQLKQEFDIIIVCEGIKAKDNPFYQSYKLTRNRGNVLYIRIPNLSNHHIYDFKYKIVPIHEDVFWVGSNNEWDYKFGELNNIWRVEVLNYLKDVLNLSFEVIEHLAVERPTIAGQQPVYEQYEIDKQIWICNGLGTRGYSNGPYITQLLSQQIIKIYF